MFSLALLAVAAYAATNIDNLFVLLAFLAETGGQRRRVIAGQFAGSLTLIVGSILLAALLTQLPTGYVGLLGILPIGVGLEPDVRARAFASRAIRGIRTKEAQSAALGSKPASATARPARLRRARRRGLRRRGWWTVACVAVANGSDNVAVYVPLVRHSHTHSEGMRSISLVFVVDDRPLVNAGAVWLVV